MKNYSKYLQIIIIWLDWSFWSGIFKNYMFPKTIIGTIIRFIISVIIFPITYVGHIHNLLNLSYNYFEQEEKPYENIIWYINILSSILLIVFYKTISYIVTTNIILIKSIKHNSWQEFLSFNSITVILFIILLILFMYLFDFIKTLLDKKWNQVTWNRIRI